jgi:hypothetical protein
MARWKSKPAPTAPLTSVPGSPPRAAPSTGTPPQITHPQSSSHRHHDPPFSKTNGTRKSAQARGGKDRVKAADCRRVSASIVSS